MVGGNRVLASEQTVILLTMGREPHLLILVWLSPFFVLSVTFARSPGHTEGSYTLLLVDRIMDGTAWCE